MASEINESVAPLAQMADHFNEEMFPLTEAPDYFPVAITARTVWRHAVEGYLGCRLGVIAVGVKKFTTRSLIAKFIRETTAIANEPGRPKKSRRRGAIETATADAGGMSRAAVGAGTLAAK